MQLTQKHLGSAGGFIWGKVTGIDQDYRGGVVWFGTRPGFRAPLCRMLGMPMGFEDEFRAALRSAPGLIVLDDGLDITEEAVETLCDAALTGHIVALTLDSMRQDATPKLLEATLPLTTPGEPRRLLYSHLATVAPRLPTQVIRKIFDLLVKSGLTMHEALSILGDRGDTSSKP